jgi:dolichol-phosphate mannosyltransferase
MFFIIKKIIIGQAPEGWTSLVVLISFSNSILMLLLFFIGEYLSRILKEISHKKAYTVKEIIE